MAHGSLVLPWQLAAQPQRHIIIFLMLNAYKTAQVFMGIAIPGSADHL